MLLQWRKTESNQGKNTNHQAGLMTGLMCNFTVSAKDYVKA